jgi:acyl-CoA thioester hydrolase
LSRAVITLPDRYLFSTEIAIRITDINYGGHLGNDSMLSLVQEARLQFLRHFGFSENNIAGNGIIMADSVIIYKSQAFYGDVLRFEITVDDMSKHACDLIYRISNVDCGKEVARAKTRIAFFDYQMNKTVPVPEAFRKITRHS